MKRLLLILYLPLLVGCETTVNSRNGQRLLRHSADSARLHYAYSGGGESIVLDIDNHQPSKTIRAGGSVIGTTGTAATGIITAWLTKGLVR